MIVAFPKQWVPNRDRWISAGVRVSYLSGAVSAVLKETTGGYNTAADLYIETDLWQASGLKGLLAFQADVEHARSPDGGIEPVTSARFKLGDDLSWYFWDGASWNVDANSWNTEAEINEGLATFPISQQTLKARVNLSTSDKRVTPILRGLKIACRCRYDVIEHVVARSLRQAISSMRVQGRADLVSSGGTSHTLTIPEEYIGPALLETYNRTADPDEISDIGVSLIGGALTTSIPVAPGNVIRVYFSYNVTAVVFGADPDFEELAQIPSVAVSAVNQVTMGYGQRFVVRNSDTEVYTVIAAPRIVDVYVNLDIYAKTSFDLLQIGGALSRALDSHAPLTIPYTGEKRTMSFNARFAPTGNNGRKGFYTSTAEIKIHRVLAFEADDSTAHAIEQIAIDQKRTP